MENITLEFVGEFVAFLVALIGGLGYLSRTLKKWLTKLIDEQQESINSRLDNIDKRLDTIDIETCKNYLVMCISDIKRGEVINETERQRFYEQYEHYIAQGGNTYIKKEVEYLQNKNFI